MKKIVALAALVLCGLCVCFVSCSEDEDEEVYLFYATYNDDGTFGSSGLTQSEWEKKLSFVSNGSKIVLPAELSSDDLETFAAALIASGKTDITLDLSNLSITSIPSRTFSGCTAITSIVLPETIVSIGSNAFSDCTSLTLVTYGGTTAEWNSISIASGNTYLTEATIVCSGDSAQVISGTFTATLDGSGVKLGTTVTVVVADSVITSVTVDGTECTAQDDGTFSYTSGDYTYAISVSESNGGYTYTYEITEGTVSATYSGEGDGLGEVTVTVSSGEITAVTVDDTECSQDDGTFSYTSETNVYTITVVSGGNGSYSYSYEASEYFGSSSTTYSDFSSLLSSLSDNCTIVLSPALFSTQLSYFVAALMNTSLSGVTVDMSYMTITEISSETFYECENITSVILPSSVTTIGSYAFYKCTNLATVEIAEGTTTIGSYAFYYCSSLKKLEIPDSVTSIDSYAFGYCSALTEVAIPDSVTSLGSRAFYNCTSLVTAEVGNGVETIPTYAFYGCSSLKIVMIGSAVTTISNYAFGNCSALATVYYNGSKSDWSGISISSTGNSYLTNATISYNSSD